MQEKFIRTSRLDWYDKGFKIKNRFYIRLFTTRKTEITYGLLPTNIYLLVNSVLSTNYYPHICIYK